MTTKRFICFGNCFFALLTFSVSTGIAVSANGQLSVDSSTKKKAVTESDLVTTVFYLKHIQAQAAHATIEALLDKEPGFTISVSERTNALFIRANAKIIKEVTVLLRALDSPELQSRPVKVVSVGPQKSVEVVEALGSFDMASVEMAATPEGVLILRGAEKDVASVQELIGAIAKPPGTKSLNVSIEIIWLTESNISGAAEFQGEIAKQLAERGFRALSVLSELEVTTVVGGRCEATDAAVLGNVSSQVSIEQSANNIAVDLKMEANYEAANRVSDITFSTTLTTPLNRWVVFGVAQRQPDASAKGENNRDLFLVRVKEPTLLLP